MTTVDTAVVPAQRPAPGHAAAGTWALLEQAQAGDTEAFAAIYRHYRETVLRFVYVRVGDRPLAEDLTADVFLRAFRRLGSVTWQGRDLGAWLVTIARNLVVDHFKSGRYQREITVPEMADADRVDDDRLNDPARTAVDAIGNRALAAAIDQLNDEQRQCILLRFFEECSVAETARRMDKNEGAIKALQYRATRALARMPEMEALR